VCTKPGDVAQKSSVKFGEELLSRTGAALGRELSLAGSNYEPKPFDGPKVAPKGSHVSFDEDEGGEDGGGTAPLVQAEAGGEAEPSSSSHARRSGDDLGGDFLLFDDSAKKKKKTGAMFRHK